MKLAFEASFLQCPVVCIDARSMITKLLVAKCGNQDKGVIFVPSTLLAAGSGSPQMFLSERLAIIFRSAVPFLLIQATGLTICILFPGIILWLPRLVYG